MKRQLLQHRLKTNIHGGTGHFQPRGNWVKRGVSQFPLVAVAGWTGLQNCSAVALTTESGAAITTEGGAPITV